MLFFWNRNAIHSNLLTVNRSKINLTKLYLIYKYVEKCLFV